VLKFEPMLEAGAIAAKDLELFTFADTPDEAFRHLQAHLVENDLAPSGPEDHRAPGIAKTRA
jgi:hypothetical protein